MNDEPARYRGLTKSIQHALALLHGGLLQRRLFRASCGCSGFHNGGLLFEPLDQFLAALLLKLAHLVPLEDGRMRIRRRQHPSGTF